jgi:ABC-type multidrug transport system ATPase subunit
MKISLTKAGKRFNRDWIFRQLTFDFHEGRAYAITGPNGSGKSTLLQAIGGALTLSEGKVEYFIEDIPPEKSAENIHQRLSIAAPYLELIEEMTVTELLQFHQQFKSFLPGKNIDQIIDSVGLTRAADKQIRYYSSGMKQRVKLAQAIFSDTELVLLDEPCTNLDAEGIALYQQLIHDYRKNRIILVSSNDTAEYGFCEEKISILEFKRG